MNTIDQSRIRKSMLGLNDGAKELASCVLHLRSNPTEAESIQLMIIDIQNGGSHSPTTVGSTVLDIGPVSRPEKS